MRPRWTAVLVCGLLAAGASLAISVGLERRYTSTATLGVGPSTLTEDTLGSVDIGRQYLSTSGLRAKAAIMPPGWLRTVAARTTRRLDRRTRRLLAAAGARTADDVEVIPNAAPDTLSVQGSAPDPRAAAALANTFADEYVSFDREAYFTLLDAAEAANRLRRRIGAVGDRSRSRPDDALMRQAELLDALEALGPRPITPVERARPSREPSSPNPVRNAAVALAVGLLAGLALTSAPSPRRVALPWLWPPRAAHRSPGGSPDATRRSGDQGNRPS